MKKLSTIFLLCLSLATSWVGTSASVEVGEVSIGELTIFTSTSTPVTTGLVWDDTLENLQNSTLSWSINSEKSSDSTSVLNLADVTELPSEIVSDYYTSGSGTKDVTVKVFLDDIPVGSSTNTYQAYGEGASLVPLILVLILGFSTGVVELALGFGVFVGACMVSGNVKDGFINTLEKYILEAAADAGHVYVYMFTTFLGGFVALLERSGGFKGLVKCLPKFAQEDRRFGQLSTYLFGILIFFDDYMNCLVVGGSLRPITDGLGISREKLAFIVDATAAPIASLIPLSSWVGYEISLIQDELDNIKDIYGEEEMYIETGGFSVFIKSIQYRYYSIFMIVFILFLIMLQRDFGPMLVAERKCVVYCRTDGGDGAAIKLDEDVLEAKKEKEESNPNPESAVNFFVPLFFLIFFVFYLLVKSGDDGSGQQTFMEKIESSDSYVAFLYGSMAASLLAALFFLIQFKKDGKRAAPTPKSFFKMIDSSDDNGEAESVPEPIMNVKELVETFVKGQAKMFPALVVLTLAWATGSIMTDVGAKRLFERWILDGNFNPGSLPTLSFVMGMLIASCTGTSWGTMAILFPILMEPTYVAADGSSRIFYATVSGILAGAIFGDHVSPISDTTVLSCVATECNLLKHVKTQFPYALIVALWSILLGTIPIGYSSKAPNALMIIIAILAIAVCVRFIGVPTVNDSGDFDIFTEIYLFIWKSPDLVTLKTDTKNFGSSAPKLVEQEEEIEDLKAVEEEGVEDLDADIESKPVH